MKDSPFYFDLFSEDLLVARRQDLLIVLETRFGAAAAKEFEPAINQLRSMERLDELMKLAAGSRRVSQFRRALVAGST
jgi:hypothetical protein